MPPRPRTQKPVTPTLTPAPDDRTEEQPEQKQHPALSGQPQTEVAQRTSVSTRLGHTDPEPEVTNHYRHEFTMSGRIDRDHPYAHLDNGRATIEAAIQRGLHPKDDVELVDLQVDEPDPASRVVVPITRAIYQVEVVPAVTDDSESNALSTIAPSDVEDAPDPSSGRT